MSDGKKRRMKGKIIAATAGLLIAGTAAAGFIITSIEMEKNFSRGDYEDPRYTKRYFYDHYSADYPREEVSFTSGENTLKGFIYGSDNDKGLIVFAHGIGTGHEGYLYLITEFVDKGWKVFTYDATGSGHSEGEGTKGLSQSAIDLDKALTFAEGDERLNTLPVFTAGHSWGGFAAAAVLNFDHDIKASASLSGYYQPEAEIYETADDMFGKAGILIRPFIWMFNKSRFGSLSSLSAVDGINKSGIPVLVTHGTEDEVIRFDGASLISQKDRITNPNAEFYVFDEEGRNRHNSCLQSKEQTDYIKNIYQPDCDKFNAEHTDSVLPEEIEAFYNEHDRDILNDPNHELVDMIDQFFSRQLEN